MSFQSNYKHIEGVGYVCRVCGRQARYISLIVHASGCTVNKK